MVRPDQGPVLVVGSGGLRTSARAVSGQLYSKAGGSIRLVEASQLVKVQVYVRQDELFELDETVELVCLMLDGERVNGGCNSSPVWEFPARERMMGWGTSVKHRQGGWDDMLHYLHGFQHPAGHVKLLAVSDGSLKHRSFAASATCGWVIYGYTLGDKQYEWKGTVAAAGGSSVHGGRRWLTSQRAELQGLFIHLIHSLDNMIY